MPNIIPINIEAIFTRASGHAPAPPKAYIAFDLNKKVIAGNIGKV